MNHKIQIFTRLLLCFVGLYSFRVQSAEIPDLNTALQNTYVACIGINDDLQDMKIKAGINTAVTGVGTGIGVGASVVGFVKSDKDKEIEELEKIFKEIEETSAQYVGSEPTDAERTAFLYEFRNGYTNALRNKEYVGKEIDELTQKSKNLGNWRTGLMAAGTATNIAGAAIAGTNKVGDDLQTKIDNCILAVKELNVAIFAAKINGEDVSEAKQIYDVCHEYEYLDISSINKRATGSMVASIVGAGVGVAGIVTSGVANSDKTRNDNTDTGKKKEKDLNTASNVLAVGATAASATATVFNATQIAAIKKAVKISEECTGVLK